jgi:hypothetical protein
MMQVRGFPPFLSFGGLTDRVDHNGSDFVKARASSIFKYAGSNGSGDANQYLADDPATIETVKLAKTIEQEAGGEQSVLPVMVSYTCNLSLGDVHSRLGDQSALAHGFGNLVLSLSLAKEHSDSSVPAGYVLNPDFLAMCQLGDAGDSLKPDYAVPVRAAMDEALNYRQINASLPDSITDTLGGYVIAVSWLVRTVAENVSFGWLTSIWGVGNSTWVHSEDPNEPIAMAQKSADYIKSLGVYQGSWQPDFLAIDRYEADDFTERAHSKGYCYGPHEWNRYFDFCGQLSSSLQLPVMLFQIPASHVTLQNDTVSNLETKNWGTGGSFIFGEPELNTEALNIHPKILAIRPSSDTGAETVEDIFARGETHDLSTPSYQDFPIRGIFTLLLGGGATTGIISTVGQTGTWTQEKMSKYMENPIKLKS